jgi:glyoxylase-like metal-dependent hydrolase (beta-lactamase superfamily II)
VIPDAHVVFAGDLFWRNMLPNLMDASIRPWIDTLDTLAKNEAGATFVPGHGGVGNTRDVAAFRDYLASLRKLVSDAQARGTSGAAIAEAVMPALRERYSRWDSFEAAARPNIADTAAELTGTKRIPQPQTATK